MEKKLRVGLCFTLNGACDSTHTFGGRLCLGVCGGLGLGGGNSLVPSSLSILRGLVLSTAPKRRSSTARDSSTEAEQSWMRLQRKTSVPYLTSSRSVKNLPLPFFLFLITMVLSLSLSLLSLSKPYSTVHPSAIVLHATYPAEFHRETEFATDCTL